MGTRPCLIVYFCYILYFCSWWMYVVERLASLNILSALSMPVNDQHLYIYLAHNSNNATQILHLSSCVHRCINVVLYWDECELKPFVNLLAVHSWKHTQKNLFRSFLIITLFVIMMTALIKVYLWNGYCAKWRTHSVSVHEDYRLLGP